MAAQLKVKKEQPPQNDKKFMATQKTAKSEPKPVTQQQLSIEEVIKQVINHHIGMMS